MSTYPTITATITGRGPTSTVPDNPSAVDAAVAVDGVEIGEVTLLPPEDGRPGYEKWGPGLDHWASNGVQRYLEGLYEDDKPLAIGAIEHAVTKAADTEPAVPR